MRILDDVYAAAFARVLFPAWESGIRRRPTLAHLARLERTQWLPHAALVEQQGEALAALVRHAAAHVPYYARRFAEHGVGAVHGAADVARLPLLTRDDAQAAGAERRSTVPPRVAVEKSTGGTTGRPLAFGYDAGSEHWRQAVKLRGYGWAGYHPGTPAVHYWGFSAVPLPWPRRAKIAVDRALRREHYVDCGRRGDADLAEAVAVLRRVRPRILVSYAKAAHDLARYVVDHRLRDWDDITVIAGAEALIADERALIEQAFGPVFETYGSRETMLIASECPAHAGLHVSMENLIVEVLVRDGDAVRAAAPGEVGEVAVTDLHNFGMPFLRYLNGDLAVALPDEPCACGRGLARLRSIEGRVAATLRDGEGRKVHGLVFHVAFAAMSQVARQFQIVQHRGGSVTVRVVPTESFAPAAEARILATAQKYLPGLPVRVERVSEIPVLPGGKRQVVVVER